MTRPTFTEAMERTHPVQPGTESVPPPFDPEMTDSAGLYGDDVTEQPGCAFAAYVWLDALMRWTKRHEQTALLIACPLAVAFFMWATVYGCDIDRAGHEAFMAHGGARP